MFEPDDYLLVRLRPSRESHPTIAMTPMVGTAAAKKRYTVRVNAQGFRSEQDTSETPAPNSLRVLCLGDSYTFGFGLENEYTYPVILERELSKLFPGRVEVINAGVPGYTSRQGLIYLDRLLPTYRPDLVIVGFAVNDGQLSIIRPGGPLSFGSDGEVMRGRPAAWEKVDQGPMAAVSALLHRSMVVTYSLYALWFTGRFSVPFEQMSRGEITSGEYEPPPGWKMRIRVPVPDYRQNIEGLASICRRRGVRLVFIEQWPMDMFYRRVLNEVAEKYRIPVIHEYFLVENLVRDQAQVISAPRWRPVIERLEREKGKEFLVKAPLFYFTIDGAHPNEITNTLLVEKIVETLSPDSPPPPPAPPL